MKLIIGGAFQGKKRYAQETYGILDGWADGSTCAFQDIESCRGIFHFHEYIRRMLEGTQEQSLMSGMEDLISLEQRAEAFAEDLVRKNPELLIVSNELGYGIVPMKREDRVWREAVGRICTSLASQADEVVRVVCGIGIRLK